MGVIIQQHVFELVKRATGRRLDLETLHFVVFRETLDADLLTVVKLVFIQVQRIDSLVWPLASCIVNLAIVIERTIIKLPLMLIEPLSGSTSSRF